MDSFVSFARKRLFGSKRVATFTIVVTTLLVAIVATILSQLFAPKPSLTFRTGRPAKIVGFSIDGDTIIGYDAQDVVWQLRQYRFWDARDGKQRQEFQSSRISLSPTGRFIGIATGAVVHVWEVADYLTPPEADDDERYGVVVEGETGSWAGGVPLSWRPASDELARYKLSISRSDVIQDSPCKYTGGEVLGRSHVNFHVTLTELESGKEIGDRLFVGDPGGCAGQIPAGLTTNYPTGEPSLSEFMSWLFEILGDSDLVWPYRIVDVGYESGQPPSDLQFSPDGRHMTMITMWDMSVLDLDTGETMYTVYDAGSTNKSPNSSEYGFRLGIDRASYSPDGGSLVVTGTHSDHAAVLDAETGEEILRLPGHEGGLSGARYSPDGRTIVTSGYDSIVRVWDAGTGEQLLEIRHRGPNATRSAHYSSDGRFIVTQSLGSSRDVMIWDAATGRRLRKHRGDWTDGDRIVLVADTRVKVYRVTDLAN